MSDTVDEVLPEALAGERLDRVVSMLDGCSRAAASKLISAGEVAIDGAVKTARSFRVEAGMRITFRPHEPVVDALPQADAEVPITVVYSDDDVIVVNKAAGLVVHPGAGRPDSTMVNGLLARFPEIAAVGEPQRPGIVHRLDADTTGLLVVARRQEAYATLVEALSNRVVGRSYSAIVSAVIVDDRGIVDAPIGRSARHRTRMAIQADGREARTRYEVIERFPDQRLTHVQCDLETGRTHQIRVHLAAIGHPLLGDRIYGARAGSPLIDRVALHARRLEFSHPTSGEPLVFESELPADFTAVLESVEAEDAPKSK